MKKISKILNWVLYILVVCNIALGVIDYNIFATGGWFVALVYAVYSNWLHKELRESYND